MTKERPTQASGVERVQIEALLTLEHYLEWTKTGSYRQFQKRFEKVALASGGIALAGVVVGGSVIADQANKSNKQSKFDPGLLPLEAKLGSRQVLLASPETIFSIPRISINSYVPEIQIVVNEDDLKSLLLLSSMSSTIPRNIQIHTALVPARINEPLGPILAKYIPLGERNRINGYYTIGQSIAPDQTIIVALPSGHILTAFKNPEATTNPNLLALASIDLSILWIEKVYEASLRISGAIQSPTIPEDIIKMAAALRPLNVIKVSPSVLQNG